jgi:D-alanyl-D-alanine dipeptidase
MNNTKPTDIIYLHDIIPDIGLDMVYATTHNFIGDIIDGYKKPVALLSQPATQALALIQEELRTFKFSLKIFDAYRPQQAVDHFVRWSEDCDDLRNQATFYPGLSKPELFSEGYIVKKSSHSRGSTVDLTIVDSNGEELDMGTPFDFFGRASWPTYMDLTTTQLSNRLLLRSLMVNHGFTPFATEWWHFTLKNEPYPNTYFNFAVE